jgi:hypothetical protein
MTPYVLDAAVLARLIPETERSSLLSGACNPVHDPSTVFMSLIDLVKRSKRCLKEHRHDRTNSSCEQDAGGRSGPTGEVAGDYNAENETA